MRTFDGEEFEDVERPIHFFFAALFACSIALAAGPADEIRTLLPKDGIPSIDNPQFAPVREADKFMAPGEMVIEVNINGDRRAYSVPLLSSHEIVNDTVGGRKIAVTW